MIARMLDMTPAQSDRLLKLLVAREDTPSPCMEWMSGDPGAMPPEWWDPPRGAGVVSRAEQARLTVAITACRTRCPVLAQCDAYARTGATIGVLAGRTDHPAPVPIVEEAAVRDRQRQAARLHDQGHTYKQIADRFGINKETARQDVHRERHRFEPTP